MGVGVGNGEGTSVKSAVGLGVGLSVGVFVGSGVGLRVVAPVGAARHTAFVRRCPCLKVCIDMCIVVVSNGHVCRATQTDLFAERCSSLCMRGQGLGLRAASSGFCTHAGRVLVHARACAFAEPAVGGSVVGIPLGTSEGTEVGSTVGGSLG